MPCKGYDAGNSCISTMSPLLISNFAARVIKIASVWPCRNNMNLPSSFASDALHHPIAISFRSRVLLIKGSQFGASIIPLLSMLHHKTRTCNIAFSPACSQLSKMTFRRLLHLQHAMPGMLCSPSEQTLSLSALAFQRLRRLLTHPPARFFGAP